MSKNPFTIKEIPLDADFCDREKEMADLISYAQSHTNVLLYSPRRSGKTSLVKRVQSTLEPKGYLTAYCDLFGVTSIEEIAGRITKSIYQITRMNENLFKKAVNFLTSFKPVLSPAADGFSVSVQPAFKEGGINMLDEMMASLDRFVSTVDVPVHLVFDEFQEITEVSQSIDIEGILRSHIQRIQCAFVFVGSRRRILLDMFNERKRPFYQSALAYPLKTLPNKDLVAFIIAQFKTAGKNIEKDLAHRICGMIKKHPYYAQKFCFFLFETTASEVQPNDLAAVYNILLENERTVFESILQGLTTKQIAMLVAIAKNPSKKVYSIGYMQKHNLGSTGGIQNSLDVLLKKDIIEKEPKSGKWFVVDPLFQEWLKKLTVLE